MLQQPILSWPLLTSNPARYSSLKRREGRPRKLAVCLGAGHCTVAGASWQVGSHGPKGEELPGQGHCYTQIPLVQSTKGHQVARQAGNREGAPTRLVSGFTGSRSPMTCSEGAVRMAS